MITIAPLLPEHWPSVREIYAQGIATGEATFETETPSWEQWNAEHLGTCRLVARRNGEVVGWAALSPVSDRCAYEGVAEVSVYVGTDHRGHGIGSRLLEDLITASEKHGIWTLQAGVFPENEASVRVHEKLGFRRVGRRERLGKLDGRWRDVVLLERRSDIVGVD